jgi:hypothetical protein
MRVPNAEHEAHPWVIGRIAPDFRLLDVWALPAPGGPDDFDAFLDVMMAFDPGGSGSALSRFLFAVRFQLGRWFGWDKPKERPIPGCSETTLADRLPADLRGTAATPVLGGALRQAAGGFSPLYRTADEWAAEISNGTVHAVMQLGWVDHGAGRWQPHMGVYIKPRGRFGRLYMTFIDPFRHLIVYPSLMRTVERRWAAREV